MWRSKCYRRYLPRTRSVCDASSARRDCWRRSIIRTLRRFTGSKGDISHKEFWAVDLQTGRERQLTNLGRRFTIGDFDVTRDGREIVVDRTRDESDIVLIDLPER